MLLKICLIITINGPTGILSCFSAFPLSFPPLILKQPASDEIFFKASNPGEYNEPLVLECEGLQVEKFVWIKDGKTLLLQLDHSFLQKPDQGTLVIESPRDEDVGQYQCVAENKLGIAKSNSVFVRKAVLNDFNENIPEIVVALEGQPFKLPCRSPGGWPKPKIYWLINIDGNFSIINNTHTTVDPEGNLCFSSINQFDSSNYTCLVSSTIFDVNKLGNRVFLSVQQNNNSYLGLNRHPPSLQYISKPLETALKGQKFELFCIYAGTPLPQVIWSKRGRPIQWSERIQQNNYGKSLLITQVEDNDAGIYTCEVANGIGQDRHSITMTVLSKPYFTVEPKMQWVFTGDPAILKCEAEGNPPPKIIWTYNGIDDRLQRHRNPLWSIKTNEITFEKVSKADTGNYGCNATNDIGYVYKDVLFIVWDKDTITENRLDNSKKVSFGSTSSFVFVKFISDEKIQCSLQNELKLQPISQWTRSTKSSKSKTTFNLTSEPFKYEATGERFESTGERFNVRGSFVDLYSLMPYFGSVFNNQSVCIVLMHYSKHKFIANSDKLIEFIKGIDSLSLTIDSITEKTQVLRTTPTIKTVPVIKTIPVTKPVPVTKTNPVSKCTPVMKKAPLIGPIPVIKTNPSSEATLVSMTVPDTQIINVSTTVRSFSDFKSSQFYNNTKTTPSTDVLANDSIRGLQTKNRSKSLTISGSEKSAIGNIQTLNNRDWLVGKYGLLPIISYILMTYNVCLLAYFCKVQLAKWWKVKKWNRVNK